MVVAWVLRRHHGLLFTLLPIDPQHQLWQQQFQGGVVVVVVVVRKAASERVLLRLTW